MSQAVQTVRVGNFNVECTAQSCKGANWWFSGLQEKTAGAYDLMSLGKKVSNVLGFTEVGARFDGFAGASCLLRLQSLGTDFAKAVKGTFDYGIRSVGILSFFKKGFETGSMFGFAANFFNPSCKVVNTAKALGTCSDVVEVIQRVREWSVTRQVRKEASNVAKYTDEVRSALDSRQAYTSLKLAKLAVSLFSGVSFCWGLVTGKALISKTADAVAGLAATALSLSASYQKDCFSSNFAKEVELLAV